MRFIWLLFLIPFVANGQHAVIRGVAPLAIGQEIQLRVYDDPVSQKERVLASQIVDVDGSFELKVAPYEVQYAVLQIGQDCADFFIERGKDVELSFVPPVRDANEPSAFYQRHFFIPKITGGKSAKLNEQIISFNDSVDAFLERLYPIMVNRRSPQIVAKELALFDEKLLKDFAKAEPFVKDYIAYSLAGVEQTFLTDKERLYNKYLKDKRVQANNPAFIDFALQFFQGEVNKVLLIDKLEESKKAMQGKEIFAAFDNLLQQNPRLQDSFLRRLVLIAGIEQLFVHKDFDELKLIAALKQFGGLSSNSYLGNAAKNVASKHEKLSVGTVAPEIVFKDVNGAEKRLSDLKGTYVFLELTDATNSYCQRETNVIPNLKEEFKNIQFVTICVGNSADEMKSLQKQLNIDWVFGGISITNSLIEDYNIKSLPLFFILDPEGKLYKTPASDPTKGAQGELMSLNEMLKAKGRKGVGK